MYALSTMTRRPMMRSLPAYWQAAENLFRPITNVTNNPYRVSTQEDEHAYSLTMDLPGFEPDEINATVTDNVLDITAEHKEGDGENEVITRNVRRRYTLDGIDKDGIVAAYKNGVLSITLPKEPIPEALQPRRIEIQSA